jgi:hypothetical protein
MFCPKCSTEYEKGFKECSDCKVQLVETLPKEPDHNPNGKFIEILRTSNASDIPLIEATLTAENIEYFMEGEAMNLYRPDAPPVLLMATEADAPRVRELVKDLELNFVRVVWNNS